MKYRQRYPDLVTRSSIALIFSALFFQIATSAPSAATRKPQPKSAATHAARAQSPAPPLKGGWNVVTKGGPQAEAFFYGSQSKVKNADLQPVAPTRLAVALGSATVYGPGAVGPFVHAGRRLHTQTPEGTVFSYESLARMAWGAGISRGQKPTVRATWSGANMNLGQLIGKIVADAAPASAWLVSGIVDYGEPAKRALFTAVVVDPKSTDPAAGQLLNTCFAPNAKPAEGYAILAYAAFFGNPVPDIDMRTPFQNIWNRSTKDEGFPHVTGVFHANLSSPIRQAYISAWAVAKALPYNLYPTPDMVDVIALDSTILTEQRLATTHNPLGVAVYDKPRFMLRKPVAEAIVRINQHLRQQGYRLKLFDAYRPLSITQKLWHAKPNTPYLAAPNVGSRHNRGAAVDCTITDMAGNLVEMPSDYLVFNETAHSNGSMSPKARANLAILSKAMTAEKFTTIPSEWWHFDAPGWQDYDVADVPLWPKGAVAPQKETPAAPEPVNNQSDAS